MKFLALFVAMIAFFFSGALAVEVKKQFIMQYPDDTPDSVVAEAKEAIIAAKGEILHEYNLIKYVAVVTQRHGSRDCLGD